MASKPKPQGPAEGAVRGDPLSRMDAEKFFAQVYERLTELSRTAATEQRDERAVCSISCSCFTDVIGEQRPACT